MDPFSGSLDIGLGGPTGQHDPEVQASTEGYESAIQYTHRSNLDATPYDISLRDRYPAYLNLPHAKVSEDGGRDKASKRSATEQQPPVGTILEDCDACRRRRVNNTYRLGHLKISF